MGESLKEAKNAYASEFRLVSVPADMVPDEECVATPDGSSSKPPKDKYFATAFRGKQGDSSSKVMSLLWTQEGGYWKIVGIRLEDGKDTDIVPQKAVAKAEPSAEAPQSIAGDAAAVKAIAEFYQAWIVKRDVVQASTFASQTSYQCLAPPFKNQKSLTPVARIQSGLQQPLTRIPSGANLEDMMSSLQPTNELLRPVQQENSKAYAIMAVPDQKGDSFLCQHRRQPGKLSRVESH